MLALLILEKSSEESKLEFSEDEITLINLMYKLVGERWSLIAGRIPGRTAEEIKEYWTSRLPAKDSGTKKDEGEGCET
ncbi:putative transcription factor MYB-HB-like family [Helianthus annuus]|nr:putative transcription factor MYB-HB-like family [Helianthus annuus]